MKCKRIFLITSLSLLLIGCVESEVDTSSSSDSFTLTAEAGDDKRVFINESVLIKGEGETTDGSTLSYLWEEEGDTLATTASFVYIPTILGEKTLRFIVQHNSGATISDTLKIMVTDRRVDFTVPKISEKIKNEYLKVVNRARAQEQVCGKKGVFPATSPLDWSEKLYSSSYEHTQDLIKSATFSHSGSGTSSDWTGYILYKKSTFKERIETYGYKWKYIAENLGGGTLIDSAEKMVQGWLDSEKHCINLMNPNYTQMGMVMIEDEASLYTHYWTQNLGKPKE